MLHPVPDSHTNWQSVISKRGGETLVPVDIQSKESQVFIKHKRDGS